MKRYRTTLLPSEPTPGELLLSLYMETMRFFAARRDLEIPAEITQALSIMQRAAHDRAQEQSLILAIGATLISRCAACEDMSINALLKRVEARGVVQPCQPWTVEDLEVLAKWSEQPPR